MNYGLDLEDGGYWSIEDTYLTQPKQEGDQTLPEEETITWAEL